MSERDDRAWADDDRDRAFADDDRPRLARGARLHRDPVEERDLLLVPEGALALNATAAAVLRLCDGRRTVSEIVEELERLYPGQSLRADVVGLLDRIAQRGFLAHANA